MFTCTTNSPEETAHLAEMVGQKIREGTVLCLEGDLGVGKTLFVQSLAHTLGVEGEVTSPTFNLMNGRTSFRSACQRIMSRSASRSRTMRMDAASSLRVSESAIRNS